MSDDNLIPVCSECKMELMPIDQYYGPPDICWVCWDRIMADELLIDSNDEDGLTNVQMGNK